MVEVNLPAINDVSAYCMKSRCARNFNVGLIRRVFLSRILDSNHRTTYQRTVCINLWARGNKLVQITIQKVLIFKRFDKNEVFGYIFPCSPFIMSGTPHVELEGHWMTSGIAVSVNMGFVIGSLRRVDI